MVYCALESWVLCTTAAINPVHTILPLSGPNHLRGSLAIVPVSPLACNYAPITWDCTSQHLSHFQIQQLQRVAFSGLGV